MGVAEQLAAARELLERAQRVPEQEALWLVTLAWSQLQEVAEVLEVAQHCGGAVAPHTPPRLRPGSGPVEQAEPPGGGDGGDAVGRP